METINDIGAAEYLGVRTLTVSIYSTWLNRGSLEGGAQIALDDAGRWCCCCLPPSSSARRRQRFHSPRGTHMKMRPLRLAARRFRRIGAWRRSALPVLFGFGIPLFVFGSYALRRLDAVRRSGTGRRVRQQPAHGRDRRDADRGCWRCS